MGVGGKEGGGKQECMLFLNNGDVNKLPFLKIISLVI